jgi:hypothetical protein
MDGTRVRSPQGDAVVPMSSEGRRHRLRGRASECEILRGLISTVRSGSCQVLVLRGEAGVGKTALLEYLSELAPGFRSAQVAGVQSDMELAFAGLQQLCAPLMDHVDGLPAPQREALNVAFGRGVGPTPNRFLVGLARDTLHMWTQIVGKIRLTHAPMVNHWWQVIRYVSPRGLTTSAMPYSAGVFDMSSTSSSTGCTSDPVTTAPVGSRSNPSRSPTSTARRSVRSTSSASRCKFR